jgi:oxygen-independent coproporphyrinogen-3 oxidase
LFHLVHDRIRPAAGAEVTVETNPGTASPDLLSSLKELGVTRLSIGVQSFSDRLLSRLGRSHDAAAAVTAFRQARSAGFGSVGIDLIYGIPDQTAAEWDHTIDAALTLGPDHLSLYALSIDPGSRLDALVRKGSVAPPDDEATAAMFGAAQHRVQDAGYVQYELSNFAKPSHACRHNLHYWDRGEYLGLGPSAWSFIGDRRWSNIPDVREYIERMHSGRPVTGEEEILGPGQARSERLLLGFRRTDGLDLAALVSAHGRRTRFSLKRQIDELSRNGFVETREGRLRLTSRGMLVSNEIIARLLP